MYVDDVICSIWNCDISVPVPNAINNAGAAPSGHLNVNIGVGLNVGADVAGNDTQQGRNGEVVRRRDSIDNVMEDGSDDVSVPQHGDHSHQQQQHSNSNNANNRNLNGRRRDSSASLVILGSETASTINPAPHRNRKQKRGTMVSIDSSNASTATTPAPRRRSNRPRKQSLRGALWKKSQHGGDPSFWTKKASGWAEFFDFMMNSKKCKDITHFKPQYVLPIMHCH